MAAPGGWFEDVDGDGHYTLTVCLSECEDEESYSETGEPINQACIDFNVSFAQCLAALSCDAFFEHAADNEQQHCIEFEMGSADCFGDE